MALEPVSILKPLKGLDYGLETNLESFFRLQYPKFELLFSVATEDDPAIALVQKLMTKHPRVQARLLVGEVLIGGNPKVNNLVRSYQSAKHDWILISDSNIRVARDYLQAVVAEFTPDTGVITALVSGETLGTGVGAALETTYLNTFYARWTLIASTFGAPVVIGKSMLLRKSEASRFGGIELLARYLAEDYMAGHAMKLLGKKVKIMSEPVVQMIGNYSLKEFWMRHVRWGRIRKSQAPLTFPLEPLLSLWISGFFMAHSLTVIAGFAFAKVLCSYVAFWFACDVVLMLKFRQKPNFRNAAAWLARETLQLPLWIHVAQANTVNWRGHKLRLKRGGLLET